MNEESNGYHLLDERIGALETRNQAQIAGNVCDCISGAGRGVASGAGGRKYDSGGTGRNFRYFGVYCRTEFSKCVQYVNWKIVKNEVQMDYKTE